MHERVRTRSRHSARSLVDDRTQIVLRDQTSPGRDRLQEFVRARYSAEYGAEVAHFMPTLMGIASGSGALLGVIGVREAALDGRLYLEGYMDDPIDEALGARIGSAIARESIAEIGNLASSTPGGGRILVTAFAHYLDALGLEWAVFTATRPLRNSFEKLGVTLVDLCAANPRRLPDEGASWGTYYATEPRVTAVRIHDVCHMSRTNRRFAGPMSPVRKAAARVGSVRRRETRAA